MHLNKSIVDIICNILRKYKFIYINENYKTIKFEYIGDDLLYKEENDFNNIFDYREFIDEQSEIVCKNLDKIKKEIENKNIKIDIECIIWDRYDYPCIYIETK